LWWLSQNRSDDIVTPRVLRTLFVMISYISCMHNITVITLSTNHTAEYIDASPCSTECILPCNYLVPLVSCSLFIIRFSPLIPNPSYVLFMLITQSYAWPNHNNLALGMCLQEVETVYMKLAHLSSQCEAYSGKYKSSYSIVCLEKHH